MTSSAGKRNLLYEYSEILCGTRKRFGHSLYERRDDSDALRTSTKTETSGEYGRRIKVCNNALFLVRFVFEYMYGYKTCEEAIMHPEVWDIADLSRLLRTRNVFAIPIVSKISERYMSTISSKEAILWLAYRDGGVEANLIDFFRAMRDNPAINIVLRTMAKRELEFIDKMYKRKETHA